MLTAAPEPGDIYIVNDPYLGGTHLMDVRFAMPVWRDGRIFCWLSNTGHWPDTGGAVPGGFSASAISAEQEGLRLPPVKLFKRGVMDTEIYQIICSNIRVSEQRIGDVQAQASALLVGADRLTGLLDRYSDATVVAAIAAMRRLAAEGVKARVVSMPSTEVFDRQPLEWREAVLPSWCRKRVAVEAGVTGFWHKYVGLDGKVVGIDSFGASAPADQLYAHFGITVDAVVEAAIRAAIAKKPKGHDFDYSRQTVSGQVSRHMSHTGG